MFLGNSPLALRMEPPKIETVIYKNIRIVAENSSPDTMSLVEAFDINTDKLLWSKEIYKVKMNPSIEADVQWVFIEELRIEDDRLIVINERQQIFILDPGTGKILSKNISIYNMNFLRIALYLFGLLPISHLVLIGLVLKESGYKISRIVDSFYAVLTVEVVTFLLSIILLIFDSDRFRYFIAVDVAGILALILQFKCYKDLKNGDRECNMTRLYAIWTIAIVIGLILWIVYYIRRILPIINFI